MHANLALSTAKFIVSHHCMQVLCSVQNPPRVVSEIKRVLRPGGRLLFIEHVAADWDKQRLVRLEQTVLNPLQQALAGGCHLTRDTHAVLESVGFQQLQLERAQLQGIGSILAPHIWGIAVK